MIVLGVSQTDSVLYMRVCILFQILYRFRLLQMRVYFPVLFGRSLFGCFMYGSVCASTRNSWFTPLLPLPRVLCFVNKFISSYLTRGCTVSWMVPCRFSLTLDCSPLSHLLIRGALVPSWAECSKRRFRSPACTAAGWRSLSQRNSWCKSVFGDLCVLKLDPVL